MNPTPAKPLDALGSSILSIALIGPSDMRRQPIAAALSSLHSAATREISAYPELDDLPRLLDTGYDVIIVELDSNPEYALDLVEAICGNSSITVMVYSEQVSPEMLVRCMRAGAREFDCGGHGSRLRAPSGKSSCQKAIGETTGICGRERRHWSNHNRKQFCRGAGP